MAKEQRIGVLMLLGAALMAWFIWAVIPAHNMPVTAPDDDARRDSLRRDSIARARHLRDSLREARWQFVKDSFRSADDARFAQWTAERQARYDSFRLADSLWRDSVGMRYPRKKKTDTVLDLNTADTAVLQCIRGIGAYTARRIVRYRDRLGGFYSPAQLTDSALADLQLDTLLHAFTATPDSLRKIDVNRASVARLVQHPYLHYSQAKAIYHLRRRAVRLRSIRELYALPELDSASISKLSYYLSFD